MKKYTLLTFATLCIATFAAPTLRADGRDDYVRQFETCEAVIREFMADQATAIPQVVLQKARAIVITRQFEAGFILGMKGGYGTILVKRADHTWSLPVLIRAGDASVGLQIGGKTIETVYIITDDATPRMLFNSRLNVGVDAKAVAGPKYAEAERVSQETLATPVIVYVKNKGLMAGATVKAGYMSRNDDANRKFYLTAYTMPELLYGNFVEAPVEVQPLIAYIKSLIPEGPTK